MTMDLRQELQQRGADAAEIEAAIRVSDDLQAHLMAALGGKPLSPAEILDEMASFCRNELAKAVQAVDGERISVLTWMVAGWDEPAPAFRVERDADDPNLVHIVFEPDIVAATFSLRGKS